MSSIHNTPLVRTAPAAGSADDQHSAPLAGLALSEAQRAAVRSIFATAKQTRQSPAATAKAVDAVLLPAQQQIAAARRKAGAAASAPSATVPTVSSAPAAGNAAANVRNQAAAAQSARINALLAQVLSTNPPAPIE